MTIMWFQIKFNKNCHLNSIKIVLWTASTYDFFSMGTKCKYTVISIMLLNTSHLLSEINHFETFDMIPGIYDISKFCQTIIQSWDHARLLSWWIFNVVKVPVMPLVLCDSKRYMIVEGYFFHILNEFL